MADLLRPLIGCSVSDPVDVDPDVERAAEDLVAAVRRRVLDEPRVLHAAEELADRDLGLQPRERGAEAVVDALAVADVLVVRAFEVESVGVLEPFRVAVRRRRSTGRSASPSGWWCRRSRCPRGPSGWARTGPTTRSAAAPRPRARSAPGRRRSFSSWSGCRSRDSTLCAIRLTVVSCPAKSMSSALLTIDSWGRRPSGPSSLHHPREHARSGLLAVLVDQVGQELLELGHLRGNRRCAALLLRVARLRAEVHARPGLPRSSRGSAGWPPAARPGPCRSRSPAPGRRTRRRRRSGSCPSCRPAAR